VAEAVLRAADPGQSAEAAYERWSAGRRTAVERTLSILDDVATQASTTSRRCP